MHEYFLAFQKLHSQRSNINSLNMFAIYISLCVIFSQTYAKSLSTNEIRFRCSGKKYENVSMAAYYPKYNYETDDEKDIMDSKGNNLMTLQDYLDDRADFVTLAMDKFLNVPYGTPVCIPELNEHFGHKINFQIRDSGSNLDRMGFHRVDICVRSEIDSYDKFVNRKVTLIFENPNQQ